MQAITPVLEIAEMVEEFRGETLHICMQCGTCSGVCPWNLVKFYSPRTIIRQLSLGMEGYEEEAVWNCVTCNTCVTRCPRHVEIIDVIRAARAVMNESGSLPPSYKGPLASLRSDGNPWGGDRSLRAELAQQWQLPELTEDHEYLYFTCCTHSYDPRNKRVGEALARLLLRSGLSFGVLPDQEQCCGDQARKVGAEEIFQDLMEGNAELLHEQRAKRVLTGSPHCLNVINKDYREAEPAVATRAEHYTEVFHRLLEEGELTPSKEVKRTVAYHDPCYLGRHNDVYEPPRKVLDRIPGLTRVEMPRNRENSLCCGGGGGGLWSDMPQDERFAVLRIQEAMEAGADTIATACPYCTSMLEDAVKVLFLEDHIEIMDVAELLSESVQ
jgi:Fe-S oxidoreductase